MVLGVSDGHSGASIEAPELRAEIHRAIDRGLKWLRTQQQSDGSWEHHPGLTALALTAFVRSPRAYAEEDGPFVRNAVGYLRGMVKAGGGIYDRDLPAYNTAVSVMAFCALGNPEHGALIRDARDFLVELQADEGEGYRPGDKFYGGIGYGNDERPDLSNLQYALEGLKKVGLEQDDPAWDRAVRFLERCQNRSESNDQSWAANDGGFVYHPGHSMAGGTRSYGSMTYAGIKSLIYANLERDDPRVKAALDWVRSHYTLDENPGLGAQGLYYYYHTFAKSLRVYGEAVIVDDRGVEHRWANELARVLLARQDSEGYWVNSESGRWWEDNKVLVTAETLLAFEELLADLGDDDDPCPALSQAASED
jgi:squalene-hopene/tetraprenyl-beta-curcumene cyclase